MKTAIIFAVASLMLVGGLLVVALPTPIQAAPPHIGCWHQPFGGDACVPAKKTCEQQNPTDEKCFKNQTKKESIEHKIPSYSTIFLIYSIL